MAPDSVAPVGDTVIARGTAVFEAGTVRGVWRELSSPDDVLALMDDEEASRAGDGAEAEAGSGPRVVAVVSDAGATFLAPVLEDLAAVVCTAGTVYSHVAIVSREMRVPCVMSAQVIEPPADGTPVEVDCTVNPAVVRVVPPEP